MADLSIWMSQEILRLKRDMDRMFLGMCRDFGLDRMQGYLDMIPQVEIVEENDVIVVRAHLPGMRMEDMNLFIDGDILTIEGEQKGSEPVPAGSISRKKTFSSRLRLPCKIEESKAEASYEEGVLNIVLPKCPPPKTHPIRIKKK